MSKNKKSFFGGFFSKKGNDDEDVYLDDEFIEDADLIYDDDEFEIEGEEDEEVEEKLAPQKIGIDFIETDEEYLVAVPIVGVDPTSVNVDITHELVTVSYDFGGTFCEEIEKDRKFICKEITSGKFTRSIMLPSEIDIESSEAKAKNGILKITLQKINKKKKRKLSVKKES